MMPESSICEENLIANVARIAKFPKEEVTMDLKLYNSRVVSSLAMLEIMNFVEKEYDIVIQPEELIEDNFGDLQKLKNLIEKKLESKKKIC